MHVKEVRAANIRLLLSTIEGRGKQVRLSAKIGKAPAQISQWVNGTRKVEEETAREIERHARLPDLWLDQRHEGGGITLIEAKKFEARELDPQQYKAYAWPFAKVGLGEVQALPPHLLARLERMIRERLDDWAQDHVPATSASKRHRA